MRSGNFTDLVDEEVQRIKKDTDTYVETYISPIAKIPSPDKLIGHPYPFNQIEIEALKQVYVYDQKPLIDYIAKMAISELHSLEEEVRLMEV